MITMEVLLILLFILAIVVLWLFFWAVPFPLWISAVAVQVNISLFALTGMRLRRVPPTLIVRGMISATKAGLKITTDQLEAHFFAGGNVNSVVNALIVADSCRSSAFAARR